MGVQIASLQARALVTANVLQSKTSLVVEQEHETLAQGLDENITRLQGLIDTQEILRFAESDSDNDQMLTIEEYVAYKYGRPVKLYPALVQAQVLDLQRKLDQNGDGHIDAGELHSGHDWFVHISHPSGLNKEL